jgi:transcriptional regulator with XRE-family HTH domain
MNDELSGVGLKIREARKSRRLTLQRIADATKLSIGFLSQVERNIAAPSLSSLILIAKALDLPISAFLKPAEIPSGVSHSAARPVYSIGDSAVAYERLSTSVPGQLLNAVKMRVPARFLSEISSHEGEELVFVVDGLVRYVIDGMIYELHTGDSLHFSTQRPHRLQNPTDEWAEIIAVATQPMFEDPKSSFGAKIRKVLAATPEPPSQLR